MGQVNGELDFDVNVLAVTHVQRKYIRITLTKTTTIFFLFSFLFCFTHSLVQSFLFALDANANALTSSIMTVAEVPTDKFAWLTRSHNSSTGEEVFTLRSCSAIPMERAKDDTSCVVVFETGEGIIDIPAGFRKRDVSTSGDYSGKYCCSDLDLIFSGYSI